MFACAAIAIHSDERQIESLDFIKSSCQVTNPPTPEQFSKMIDATTGLITIIGFGSLVEKRSAARSFTFSNFRMGQIVGWNRIFNLSSWINIGWGGVRRNTGEVAALAFGRVNSTSVTQIALMDIDADGLKSFLQREAGYDIVEIPYTDVDGKIGTALACCETTDEEAVRIWGDMHLQGGWGGGKIFHYPSPSLSTAMPLVPLVEQHIGSFVSQDITKWVPLELEAWNNPDRPFVLPNREHVYPAPFYFRLCYRAHLTQGPELAQHFLDNTYLMDRVTTVNQYLAANPLLATYILDPAELDRII